MELFLKRKFNIQDIIEVNSGVDDAIHDITLLTLNIPGNGAYFFWPEAK